MGLRKDKDFSEKYKPMHHIEKIRENIYPWFRQALTILLLLVMLKHYIFLFEITNSRWVHLWEDNCANFAHPLKLVDNKLMSWALIWLHCSSFFCHQIHTSSYFLWFWYLPFEIIVYINSIFSKSYVSNEINYQN